MKTIPGNRSIIFLVALVFLLFNRQTNAACSRDDVSFYLDKGFITDQITVLCSASSTPAGDAPQSEPQDSEKQSVFASVDDNALFLQRAIKAQNIQLSSDSLQYTHKICIQYGEEDLYGFTPKVCPDVTYIISRKDLTVLETGKRYYFYGTPEIRVISTIRRIIIGDLKDSKPEDRALILEEFEQGDETAIPIRDDFSLEQVKKIIQGLSI